MARYDVVVVGAGSAGSVLAAGLSEDPGTSVLVQNAELASGGGRCFIVATAPDAQGAPGTPSAPACTPDASIEGMQQAAPAG